MITTHTGNVENSDILIIVVRNVVNLRSSSYKFTEIVFNGFVGCNRDYLWGDI